MREENHGKKEFEEIERRKNEESKEENDTERKSRLCKDAPAEI
jgi:hypothetical protein